MINWQHVSCAESNEIGPMREILLQVITARNTLSTHVCPSLMITHGRLTSIALMRWPSQSTVHVSSAVCRYMSTYTHRTSLFFSYSTWRSLKRRTHIIPTCSISFSRNLVSRQEQYVTSTHDIKGYSGNGLWYESRCCYVGCYIGPNVLTNSCNRITWQN